MKFQTIPAWNARKHVVKIAAALVFILGMDGWVLAAHPDVTDFDSGLVVTEDTTFSGVTNRYDRIGNKIHANLTLENYSYVRIQGHATIQGTIPMGPVDSSAVNQCPVVTIKSNCGFYASYRNTPGFLDEEDSNVKRTSQTFVLGQNGGSGRFLVQAKGNNFGANVDNVSLWIERLVVSPNATTDGDRFDILQLDQNGNADITCIVNENAKPARIVFNGGWLRNSYMNGAGFQLSPAEGCVLELEAINWNDIKIVKAFLSSTLNGGKGTVRFKGKCNIVIQEKGGNLPGIGNSNRMPYYLAATNSPIEWKQTGNLVLDSNAFITCMDDDQLPYKAETGIVRLQSNAILDPNGTSQKLRSLIATSSSALVTNAMARHEGNTVTSTLVFGADDQDGVFSATCCDNVNVEKIGSGTLVVSNVTVRGTFTVSAGRVVFVGNNVFENPVVYADGVEVVTPPTSPNPIVNLCDDARIPAGTGAYRYMYVKEDAGTTYAYAGDYLDGLDIDIRSGTLKFTGITTDKWWRFTFKAAADVTQSSTGAVTRAELGTISLMATNAASFAYKDDKCLSLGLQTNNVQPSSYADLQPGYCMHGIGETPCPYEVNGRIWMDASALFDQQLHTVFKTAWPSIKEHDPSTWNHVVLRLPTDSGPVASYGLQTTQWGHGASLYKWMVESSANGIDWTVRDDHVPKWGVTTGLSKEEHFKISEFPKDDCASEGYFNNGVPYQFTQGATAADTLEGVKVAVATNAVLDTSYLLDSAIAIASLTIDCVNGAGTITKFAPAENGALYLVSMPPMDGFSYRPPVTFGSVVAADRFASWRVYVDGVFSPFLCVAVDGSGRLVVRRRRGVRVLIR